MTGAGDLRHRVDIGRYVEGTDQWGNPLPRQWEQVAQVWASVEGLSGRLLFEAQQTALQSDHRVTIRYRKGIEPGMIVRWDGRELEIQAVLDRDGRRRWLELTCREVRAA